MGTLDDALAALDETPESLASTQTKPSYAPPSGTLDDALAALDAAEQTDTLKANGQLGLKKSPSSSTKVLQLFGKTGLPKDFIERNQAFVEEEAAKADFNPDKLMKDSPAFASWLAEHPDHVAAAKPDLSKLSYLERQWRHIQHARESGPLLVELGDLGNKALLDTITPQDRARQAAIEKRLDVLGRSDQENDITGFFEGIPAAVVEQAPLYLRSLGGKVEYGAKGLVAGTALGAATGSVAGPPGSAAGATAAGITMGLAGWRYGAAIEAGKLEQGHALLDYEKLRDEQGQPLDRTTIKGLSLMAGTINGALEGLTGVEALANKLPGVRNLVRSGVKELLKTPTARAAILRMGKEVGDVMLTEGATEALQMYVTKAGGELAKWAVDGGGPVEVLGRIFSRENFEQAKQEAIKGAQSGGGTAMVLSTPALVQDLRQVRQASKNQRAFQAMGKAAESSQFVNDLPDQLKEIIQRATEKGPVEQLYVPTEAFSTYFQSQGADPRQVYQEITGDADAYDQAVETGHPLPIKTADYAAKLAGTPHNEFFSRELKTDLDAMNAREADEWTKMMDEQAQAEAQQAGVAAASVTDPTAKVRQDILGQLQAAGFDPTVADQYAGLMAERYATRAQRRGLGEDPYQLFQQLGLTIQRQLPEVLRSLGTKVTELDALLDRLRVGDVPKEQEVFGQSLVDFLRDKGGLQDQGGELSSRDLQRDPTRKPGQKKLVNEKGLTLDQAAELAAEAGYIEERDLGALLDAIDKESRGTPVYAVGRENPQLYDVHQNLESLKNFLADRGVNLTTTSNEDIRRMLGDTIQQPLRDVQGQTFQQAELPDTIEIDGIQRPTTNSEGKPIATTEEGVRNFWKWFGESKVVDAQGRPVVAYHGTTNVFSTFKKDKRISVTSNAGVASFYANYGSILDSDQGKQSYANVIPVYVRLLNPKAVDSWTLEHGRYHNRKEINKIEAQGYDGLVHQNATFANFNEIVVFHREQIKSALGNRGTFSPSSPNILHQDGAKGAITFGDGMIDIKLLESADLSTFIHETGHLWLNELIDDATTEGTPAQLRDDLDTLLKWMGLEVTSASGRDAIRAAVQTAQHEQFARGFEAYTMEGKAPSSALREIFATFRQWLIQVYRSLITAPLNVKLTKDVRAVMDRMIATDEAIDQAAQEADVLPAFTTSESAGMSKVQWEAYQDLVRKASLTARETLQAKLMRQYQREQEAWWAEKREEMQAAVTTEINDLPEYTALAVLKTGKMPDGSEIPHGIPAMKLDKKGLIDTFGKDFVKTLPKGITGKDGMHHDAAAQLFGYQTGQEFVMALVNARPKDALIEAETDRRMRETYGDIRFDGTLASEAQAAVLNEHQAQVIEAELKAIAQKQREVSPFLKAAQTEQQQAQAQGRDLLALMVPTLDEVRKLARGLMARTALKNLNPNSYSIAARHASRQATAALAKDDWVKAGYFKQRELLNLALFREAGIVKDRIEQAKETAKGFFKADSTLAKSRNMDLVNVGRAILAQYGLGTQAEKTAAEYLEPIKNYDQDLYHQWKPQVDALAPSPLPYTALNVEEFTKLADDLDALWTLSRRVQQVKIEGQLLDRQAIIDDLTGQITALTTREQSKILGDPTPWEDAKVGLLSFTSALRRVESWVDAMDGGRPDGAFRRYIWTPIQDAAVTFRTEKAKLLTQYLALLKPIEKTMTHDLIPAPELGPGFAFRGKAALLHAILHTGNESNKAKLLKGYGWDAAQWDAFIARAQADKMLTKADYDYAQGVWDLLDSIKPDAQKAHHEMYGYYFNEITATPFSTPWGEYRGGYVPAIADAVKSVDQAIRQEKELFDQAGNSFMFPTTGRGFTKTRVEQYAAPLALNLATIPIHLDKVMRFVHLEPRVKDAARLITNKGFRASLDSLNPTVAKDMLVPWLQRSAQQKVSTPGKNRHMDRVWTYLRSTVGAQVMVGNVVNTLQQFTGFSLSLTKVKATYLRGGLVTYLKGPSAMAEMIHEKSPYMAQRLTTQVMEVQASIDDILLNPSKYDKAKDFAKRHGYFMQRGTQNIVDLITWSGAYDQAIANGAEERQAVREADAAVRQTQGSFEPESLSNFEAGTPFVRAFTMFYSYFNMQANLLGTEFQKLAQGIGLKKGAGRAFYLYFVGFLIPAVMAEAIVAAMGGFDPDDDDDYLNETLSTMFLSQIRTALAMVPGVGPVALAGINAFNRKWYDDRISTSPVISILESAVTAPHSLYKAMAEEGRTKRAVRDVLTLLGVTTGLPTAALNRPAGYLADVYDGVAKPDDLLDVTRGLISGKDVNRTK